MLQTHIACNNLYKVIGETVILAYFEFMNIQIPT